MMPRKITLLSLLLFTLAPSAPAAGQEMGPANGSLVIVGGAMRDTAIASRFVQLAGGADARIVVIPTAGGGESYDGSNRGLGPFQGRGAEELTVLHTLDRDEANSDAFVEPIRNATGVWFGGGRQWRLVDAYAGTRVLEEIRKVLDRGGVIGGSSAGASIQGDFLARGDTSGNTIMMGSHQKGFAFLKGTAIDQHLLMRNRQFDLIEIVRAHPELLGIGIDEDTAIIVEGDSFEVVGQGYVAIYDHESMLDSGGLFYFLAPGDRFDLVARTGTRPGGRGGSRPIGRVERARWPGGR